MLDFQLMQHQKDAIHKGTYTPNLFLAFEQGTGKTCTAIQLIRHQCAALGRLKRILIFCPLVVTRNWKKEFEMFSNIDQKDIHVLDGPIKKRAQKVLAHVGYGAVFITNYDCAEKEEMHKAIKKWNPEILVCDEAHYVKSYQSKRAKAIANIADGCTNRYMLTGTPILNNTMDLFMQYRIMDGGKTFGANFFAFRAMFFKDENAAWSGNKNYFPKWVPRAEMQEELKKRISATTLRVTKKECLDLPDLITQNIEVELNDEQKRLYSQMQKAFITYIERGEKEGTPAAVVARLAITKVLRLQQIVSGFVKTEEGETIWIKNNPRLAALSDLLSLLTPSHKVIVWATFKENYKMIAKLCEELDIPYREIHGEQNGKEKAKAAQEFNELPGVRVLIGNQAAGGVGVNLVSSSYSIYYSRGFKWGDDAQSEARNHRRGSEIHDKITRINLIAKETIDELIDEALKKKLDISEHILSFAKQLNKERT